MVQRNTGAFLKTILVPLYVCITILVIYYLQTKGIVRDQWLAVYPRKTEFLHGIFTSPLVHGDLQHLIGNLSVLAPLLGLLYYTHKRFASQVLWSLWITTGFLVWIFARPSLHIGASGLVYAIQVYILVSGMLKRRPWLMAIGAVSIMLFGGGFLFGLLPFQPGVSWESHGLGAITGFIFALIYRNKYPFPVQKKSKHKFTDDYRQFGVK